MSEFKGTKGAWEVHDNGYFFDIQVKGTTLASTQNNLYLNIDEKVQLANAKLIACAPEMLEMLNECIITISRLQNSMMAHPDHTVGSEFYDYTSLAQETIDKTEELIKKATL